MYNIKGAMKAKTHLRRQWNVDDGFRIYFHYYRSKSCQLRQ